MNVFFMKKIKKSRRSDSWVKVENYSTNAMNSGESCM